MTGDMLMTASAVSAAPSVGVGLIVALVDPEGHPTLVALVVFVLITAAMTRVLA